MVSVHHDLSAVTIVRPSTDVFAGGGQEAVNACWCFLWGEAKDAHIKARVKMSSSPSACAYRHLRQVINDGGTVIGARITGLQLQGNRPEFRLGYLLVQANIDGFPDARNYF